MCTTKRKVHSVSLHAFPRKCPGAGDLKLPKTLEQRVPFLYRCFHANRKVPGESWKAVPGLRAPASNQRAFVFSTRVA